MTGAFYCFILTTTCITDYPGWRNSVKYRFSANVADGGWIAFRPSLPCLPVEIWIIIVSNFCLMNWTSSLNKWNPWNMLSEKSARLEQENRSYIATKYALCLVSRQFYAITRRFLYQYIRITNEAHLYAMAERILFPHEDSDFVDIIKRHTRRVEICLTDDPAVRVSGPVYISASAVLRTCAPKLSHLTIAVPHQITMALLQDIAGGRFRKLRVLRWRFLHPFMLPQLLPRIASRLQVLDIPDVQVGRLIGVKQRLPTFPRLHTLRISSDALASIDILKVPALRILDITCVYPQFPMPGLNQDQPHPPIPANELERRRRAVQVHVDAVGQRRHLQTMFIRLPLHTIVSKSRSKPKEFKPQPDDPPWRARLYGFPTFP